MRQLLSFVSLVRAGTVSLRMRSRQKPVTVRRWREAEKLWKV